MKFPLNFHGVNESDWMVGRPGFEPGTNNLKGCCSTIELSTRTNTDGSYFYQPGQSKNYLIRGAYSRVDTWTFPLARIDNLDECPPEIGSRTAKNTP
jgi:hypothetical protein